MNDAFVKQTKEMENTIALPDLGTELFEMTGVEPPSYTVIYTRAASGHIRAKRIGRAWFVNREDLHFIAERSGMLERETAQ